jgi:Ca2+-binding EF-hand superfamily protein
VGLGGDSPKTQSFRLASVFFLPCTVAVLGQLLARVAATKMKRENRRAEREYLSRTLTLCDLETMDTDQDGRVDRAEFLAYMLVAIQRVSSEDVEQINRLFNKLDRRKTGFLSKQNLQDIHLDDQLINSVRRASISSIQQLPQP